MVKHSFRFWPETIPELIEFVKIWESYKWISKKGIKFSGKQIDNLLKTELILVRN